MNIALLIITLLKDNFYLPVYQKESKDIFRLILLSKESDANIIFDEILNREKR